MDQIADTCTQGNERIDLVWPDESHHLMIEAYINGEFYDCQTYESHEEAHKEFEAFKLGLRTVAQIFGDAL